MLRKMGESMTLQQLKYVVIVAKTGTITEAANKLYISQPSLTNGIHKLEKEMITLRKELQGIASELFWRCKRYLTGIDSDADCTNRTCRYWIL